jgi:vesicle-associated membrane protein 7
MSDKKLRCALAYRLESGSSVLLAKYDYASQYESHGGAVADETTLYGGRDKSYADAVAAVISNDPPGGLAEHGTIGGFKVVQSDQHQVVYGADLDGICLAVITGLSYPSRVAIQMLQELYTTFMDKVGGEAAEAAENGLSRKAKSVMADACKKYDDLGSIDKAASLTSKVDVVKTQMQSNISDMLKNTEKADSLAEKSDQLNEQASVFKKKSTDLRKQMAWKNLKMTLLLGGLVIVILLVILIPLIKNSKKD